jgi:hypothetical protein
MNWINEETMMLLESILLAAPLPPAPTLSDFG